MQECTGSAVSGENVPKATPLVVRSKTLPNCTQPRYTASSTTSGGGEADTQQPAATDEDAPNVKRVGGIFMDPTSVVLEAQVYKYWEGNSTGKGGQKQWDQKCLRLHMLQTVQIE